MSEICSSLSKNFAFLPRILCLTYDAAGERNRGPVFWDTVYMYIRKLSFTKQKKNKVRALREYFQVKPLCRLLCTTPTRKLTVATAANHAIQSAGEARRRWLLAGPLQCGSSYTHVLILSLLLFKLYTIGSKNPRGLKWKSKNIAGMAIAILVRTVDAEWIVQNKGT